ncbi:alpha-1,3-mannosyl-glycoprotein 4-beta-N-acetylglucosaminyltransferase-like protein MGAT4D [Grus japonensis]|uniref:Alpha-1,3-mannosyl-glycoprotein 4-beta-N-acetylglucosaminyltransferase-like protein MGAT4D n=1 Tax=Grus japonensis TaxID=30415 RepID=A0ABC9WXN9_GRUJA
MRLRHGPLLTVLCLGGAFPLLWYAAWQGSQGNDLDMYQSQLLELRQRLLYAEKENKKRSHELSSALDEIKRVVARRMNSTRNHTDDMKWKALNLTRKLPMHLTNMYYYLPHLREYEDAIFPNVIFGQQRTGVSLVMGIPTVKREKQHYLISTLHSLLYELPEEQKNDCVIIIFVAEVNAEYVNSVAESVKTSFPQEIQSGVLEVISPPASYYPDLSNLKKTFGDSEDRLEDDIVAKPDYIQSIKNFAAKQSQEWMILEFSQLGFIGKLFKSEDLPLIVEFFLMFYKDKPIDWLIDHLLWVKVCNPEKNAVRAFENGIAEGTINQSIGKIQAIRLSVNSDSPVWAILSEITSMHLQWDWLCLSVLIISSVTAEIENEETLDADVKVEDFDKQSQEADVDREKSSLEVVYQTPKPTGEVYFTETFDGVLAGWVLSKTKKEDTDDDIAKYDVLKPDDTFEMLIDQSVVSKGSLLEDMVPPVNPPKEIEDPSDKKPDDWDERPKIPDPNAVKPDDWDEDEPSKIADPDAVKPEGWLDDEPQYVPDPNAKKPKDWDEEMDGEWEAPQIPNPKCETAPGCGHWVRPMKNNPNYKGKWKAPMIDNPNYQGIWSPRKIPNPDYFEDLHPFKMTTVSAIGLELWSMTSDIYFDNFIICSEKEVADRWAADGWGLKKLVASANEKTDEDIDLKKMDVSKSITKGELKQEREELEDDEIELEEKENEDTVECEDEGEGAEDIDDEENEVADGSQEEGDKSNKSGSEDEMKEADESTGSGDGPLKSVRKRRVRKD